jgi:transposase-like protein
VGQILHGSAKTTHAVRASIQRSKASIQELASRYDLNPKTVMKWRKRAFLYDAPTGPKVPRSTVLSAEEEALAVAFRKHTLLPLDDCLYALQAIIPHLTRSSLHRLFQRHEISRLPAIEGETGRRKEVAAPADHPQDVGGGCLLLQRFAQLVEQAGVPNGDDGLGSKVLDQLDLLFGEPLGLLSLDVDGAD